jgi:hypothetical protein
MSQNTEKDGKGHIQLRTWPLLIPTTILPPALVPPKFCLVELDACFGFRAHELREIQSIVLDCRAELLEAWNEFLAAAADERVLDVSFTDDALSVFLHAC